MACWYLPRLRNFEGVAHFPTLTLMVGAANVIRGWRRGAHVEGGAIVGMTHSHGMAECVMTDRPTPGADLPPHQQAIRARCVHPTGAFVRFEEHALEQSIAARFEQQVVRHRDRVAVKTGQHAFTYDELNRAANRVARAILARQGIRRGARGPPVRQRHASDRRRARNPEGRQVLRATRSDFPARETGSHPGGCRGATARHQHTQRALARIDGGKRWSARRGHARRRCLR